MVGADKQYISANMTESRKTTVSFTATLIGNFKMNIVKKVKA